MLLTHFSGISIKISIDFSRFPRKQILFSTSLPVSLALVLFVQLLFIKRYLWHAIRHRCVRHCEDWKNIFALKPMESVTWIPEIGLLFTWTRMVDFYSGRWIFRPPPLSNKRIFTAWWKNHATATCSFCSKRHVIDEWQCTVWLYLS